MRENAASALVVALLAAAATVAGAPATALAQSPERDAQRLFDEAADLATAGKYAAACPKLEESQRLDPALGTQFNLADCYEHTGRPASAHALFAEVARVAKASGKQERAEAARQRAVALEPKLPALVVSVHDPAPDQTLKIDGAATPPSRAPVPVDPGDHVLEASAPGRRPWRTSVHVDPAPGARTPVEVPALASTAVAPSAFAITPLRVVAIVAAVAGVGGIVLGSVFGADALSKKSEAQKLCSSPDPCGNREGADRWTAASDAGTLSTVAFAAGGVALAGGVVLWIAGAPSSPSVAAPGRASTTFGLQGRW